MIPLLLAVKEASFYFLRTVLYPPAEAHFGTSQGSKRDLFERKVNGFKLR